MKQPSFSSLVLDFYQKHKRTLPFRGTKDAYKIWVSEIMLQQTRTETVCAYYTRFIEKFPDVFALHNAKEQEVLKLWEGLGYYSRARNLLECAHQVVSLYNGIFPNTYEKLIKLKGIGDYTASAILSIAYDLPYPSMDGNLTRVLSRCFGYRENVSTPSGKRALLQLGQKVMPKTQCGAFNQALMDIGATICVPGTPDCNKCPLLSLCDAYKEEDQEDLPLLPQKSPKKNVDLSVLLLVKDNKIFLEQRTQALLKGLYVFLICEKGEEEKALKKHHIKAHFDAQVGTQKHVFTHLVWHMDILKYTVLEGEEKGFYTLKEMLCLPLPTAMKEAKKQAQEILK